VSVLVFVPLAAVAFSRAQTDSDGDRERLIRDVIVPLVHPGESLLRALRLTPRHELLPEGLRSAAYRDQALEVDGSVLPKPSTVALMIHQLEPNAQDRVLLVGSNTSYEAALLSTMAHRVFIIEMTSEQAKRTASVLRRVGCANIFVREENGLSVWASEGPFQRVMLSAPAAELPPVLVDQLAVGGRLVAPIGPRLEEELVVVQMQPDGNLSWSFAGPVQLGPPVLSPHR
jgi:protein-L-isoaspartate(D-aspartate) O-methyltransferase